MINDTALNILSYLVGFRSCFNDLHLGGSNVVTLDTNRVFSFHDRFCLLPTPQRTTNSPKAKNQPMISYVSNAGNGTRAIRTAGIYVLKINFSSVRTLPRTCSMY
jgi:hypothetical protein